MSGDSQTRIALIPKGGREAIAVELSEWHGHRLGQVRIVVPGETETATRKVVAFKLALIGDLAAALTALTSEAQRRGWL